VFIVLLKFSKNKSKAAEYMNGHNNWVNRGFDDGVFLMTGTLQPSRGGVIVGHRTSLAELQTRVKEDPFVAQQVVETEIFEIGVSRADPRLNFVL
jgi:uncharacterized protein YciI